MLYWFLLITVIGQSLRMLIVKPSPEALIACYFVIITTVKSLTESALIYQHDIDYLMFCIILMNCLKTKDSRTVIENRNLPGVLT
jgi:hypothetical protein